MNIKMIKLSMYVVGLAIALASSSLAQFGPDPGDPDTVLVTDGISSVAAGWAALPITFHNDEALGGLEITLTWDSPNIHVDSFSFVDGRLTFLSTIGWSATSTTISIYAVAFADLIPAGTGLMGTLYVGYPTSISPQIVTLDTVTVVDNDIEHRTIFSDDASNEFIPQSQGGVLDIQETGCCLVDRGNVDGDPEDAIDISDLVYLVEYMFQSGPEPPCLDEANVDGAAEIDISDLVYLVEYMFQSGPSPAPCR